MSSKSTGRSDVVFLAYILILLVFGLIMLTSASAVNRFDTPFFFIKRQLLLGVVPGILAFFFFAKMRYEQLKKLSLVLAGGAMLLLLLVLIPGIGAEFGTRARSWIVLGGFSFQPAEVAKLGVVFLLSTLLAKKGAQLQDLKMGFLPVVGMGLIPVALVVLQPDIGSAAILFTIVFGMLFAAHAKWSHLGLLAGAAVLGLVLLILVAPYRAERLTTFLNPDANLDGAGYHIRQAQMAIGSGGFLGRGLGHSRQKHAYLPEVHADSIFAIMAEEIGFIMVTAFLVLLVLIARRGIFIAKASPDLFGRLLVIGILIWMFAQSILNIGSMMGLLPITGVPLPFISHGGTALMIMLAAMGCIANVSRQ